MTQAPNFGDGEPVEAVTYHTIASQVRAMNPRALTPSMLDDVVTMLEYLRDEALRIHDANEARSAELDARERELNKRARDVAVAGRVAKAVISGKPKRLFNFGR
jgi:hypothetical protein